MELIRRKILLEDLISRKPGVTYGTMTASTIYVKVFLTQNVEDMGMYTDVDFSDAPVNPPYSINGTPNTKNILSNKLITSGITFPFMSGITPGVINLTGDTNDLRLVNKPVDDYYKTSGILYGFTDSKLSDVKTYNISNPYVIGFDINQETYINYTGDTINGVDRLVSIDLTNGITGYTFNANNDAFIGTLNQTTGLYYNDAIGTRTILNDDTGIIEDIGISTVRYFGEGWNETNSSLSAITKEEIYLGVVSPPEVQSDIFIERGVVSVLEPHMRLSEVESLEHLLIYGNGYYNIITQ